MIPEGDIVTVSLESNVEIQTSFSVNVFTVDGTAEGEREFPGLHTSTALYSPCSWWCVHVCSFSLLTSWGRLHGTQQCCGDL